MGVPARGEAGDAAPLLATPFAESYGRLSRDGRWLAYMSDEAGRSEVYVTQFPSPVGKWRVSTAGGGFPRWRGDGRELFFVSPRNVLMTAEVVEAGGGLEVGAPRPVVPGVTVRREEEAPFDVAADGQRFVVNVVNEAERAAPVVLLVGWPR